MLQRGFFDYKQIKNAFFDFLIQQLDATPPSKINKHQLYIYTYIVDIGQVFGRIFYEIDSHSPPTLSFREDKWEGKNSNSTTENRSHSNQQI
jgi:hypothetical protein